MQNIKPMLHNYQHLTLSTISGRLAFDDIFKNKMMEINKNFETLFFKRDKYYLVKEIWLVDYFPSNPVSSKYTNMVLTGRNK